MGGSESNGNIEKDMTSVHTGRNITEPRAPAGQKQARVHGKRRPSVVLGLLLKQSTFPAHPRSLLPTVLHNFPGPTTCLHIPL